jgi:hypothetical protein
MLRWDQYEFDKKHIMTRYIKLVFLHPVGFAIHIVHSSASIIRNSNTIFFMLGGDQYGLEENALGQLTQNFCFYILYDLWVT